MSYKSEKLFDDILNQANIVVRLENTFYSKENITADIKAILDGPCKLSPRGRMVIPLPIFHGILNYELVHNIASAVDKTVTSLDEYLGVCREILSIKYPKKIKQGQVIDNLIQNNLFINQLTAAF